MKNKILFEDEHYKLDDETGQISFVTDHKHYHLEKRVFAQNGINIDNISDVNEYDELAHEFRHQISQAFHEQWQKIQPQTLSKKLAKSLILGDTTESARVSHLIDKKSSLNLRVVK